MWQVISGEEIFCCSAQVSQRNLLHLINNILPQAVKMTNQQCIFIIYLFVYLFTAVLLDYDCWNDHVVERC